MASRMQIMMDLASLQKRNGIEFSHPHLLLLLLLRRSETGFTNDNLQQTCTTQMCFGMMGPRPAPKGERS